MKFIKTLIGGAVLSASIAVAQLPANPQSFYMTNCLGTNSANVAVVTINALGFPTNIPYATTNGAGWGTGVPVNIAPYDRIGFFFQGYVATNVGNASSNLSFTLVRSCSASYPTNIVRTNKFTLGSTAASYSDWESPSNANVIVLTIPIPAPPFTNWFSWQTNLPGYQVDGANWLGIYSVLGGGTNLYITNVTAGINGKLIVRQIR